MPTTDGFPERDRLRSYQDTVRDVMAHAVATMELKGYGDEECRLVLSLLNNALSRALRPKK